MLVLKLKMSLIMIMSLLSRTEFRAGGSFPTDEADQRQQFLWSFETVV